MNTVEENKIAVDVVADALADRFTDQNYAEKELDAVLIEIENVTIDISRLIPVTAKNLTLTGIYRELKKLLKPSHRAELVKRMSFDD